MPTAPLIVRALPGLVAFLLLPSAAHAQPVRGTPPPDASPPPVIYEGLVPGVSTLEDAKKKLGQPEHEALWYSWKMLYPSKTRPGHFDAIHIQDNRLIGNIEAATVPDGFETWPAVRARLGEPEFLLEFSRQSLADYSECGVRFTFDGKGRTIGVAYFPHGYPRVHAGERKRLSLRPLRQGPQPSPVLAAENAEGVGSDRGGADLLCGAAEADITPQEPHWLPMPFVVHDPLRARAAVFVQGDLQIAIVGGDIFGMRKIDIDPIEKRLQAKGLSHLLLAMSHVHSAGDPIGVYGHYPTEFVKRIQDGVFEAVTKALGKVQPVGELHVASAELPLDGARVEGFFRNARNPGLVDPQIAVVQALGENGRPIVTLAHLACHPEGIQKEKDKPLEISADFPGYLCDRLREATGAQAVFLNGALGGMVSGDTKSRTHEETAIQGKRLGQEFKRLLETAVSTSKRIAFDRYRIEIPVSNPKLVAFEMASGRRTSYRGRNVTEMFHIRLGAAEMVTVPGELLPEISFEILERMRGYPRMIVGLANDEIGYIIPAYDFRAGVYEESMSLGPAAGLVILRQALRILGD